MAANQYITVKELKTQPVGLSLDKYSKEQLTNIIGVASQIIENYCRRKFGPATYVETGQTRIDREGRIVIAVKNQPINVVSLLKVWASGMRVSERLSLDVDYLNIMKDAGYMYYATTHSPWSSYGQTYPWIILGNSEVIFYEITYSGSGEVPPDIKYAAALMVANLLKMDYLFKTEGVIGAKGVESFRSDDYMVKFSQMKSDDNDAVLSPPVRQILDRYAALGQNSF